MRSKSRPTARIKSSGASRVAKLIAVGTASGMAACLHAALQASMRLRHARGRIRAHDPVAGVFAP
jgi:hypothetical protein